MSKLVLSGDTSGSVTLDAPAVSGTTTLTLPTTSGTVIASNSSGDVGIGTTSPTTTLTLVSSINYPFIHWNNSSNTNIGFLGWHGGSGGGDDFRLGTASTKALTLQTNSTERMRIDSNGNVLVGKTVDDFTTAGVSLFGSGRIYAIASGTSPIYVNRLTNDGELITFAQASTTEGSISVSGTTVSYNGGHIARWSQLYNETTKVEVYRGTVLESVDAMCEWEKDGEPLPNEQATKTIVSATVASKAIAGVFDKYDEDDQDNPYDFYVAQSGDFVIRIAQGVTVQNGDLLESAGDGTARPQTDDICRSSTIAKVTSNYVSATYEDGSYCVPCILMIG